MDYENLKVFTCRRLAGAVYIVHTLSWYLCTNLVISLYNHYGFSCIFIAKVVNCHVPETACTINSTYTRCALLSTAITIVTMHQWEINKVLIISTLIQTIMTITWNIVTHTNTPKNHYHCLVLISIKQALLIFQIFTAKMEWVIVFNSIRLGWYWAYPAEQEEEKWNVSLLPHTTHSHWPQDHQFVAKREREGSKVLQKTGSIRNT